MRTVYLIIAIIVMLMIVAGCSQKSYNVQPVSKVQTENKAQQIISQKTSNEVKSQDAFSDFKATDDLDLAIQELDLIE